MPVTNKTTSNPGAESQPKVRIEHSLPTDEPVPAWYPPKVERLLRFIEAALEPLYPGDQAEERRKMARVLWSAVHGICSLANSNKLGVVADATAEDLCDTLIDACLDGIAR